MIARGGALLACAALLASAACESPPPEKVATDAASPNVGIAPSPLASGPEAATTTPPVASAAPEAPPPEASAVPAAEPIAPARELPPDTPSPRELGGVTLAAVWRWRDVPIPPKATEVVTDAISKAAKQTQLTWQVEVTENGRMRIAFTSRALPLPMYTELAARADRLGNVLVWPSHVAYRVVPVGALRTILGERRVDVTPLVPGVVKPAGEGKKLGVAVRRVEITSAIGSVKLELGSVPEVDAGGPLFCRALVEIAGVDPHTPACQNGEIPLSAAYAWTEGGGVTLEVTSLTKKSDIPAGDALVPPPEAVFQASGLPAGGDGVFFTQTELASFRSAPIALPPVTDPAVPGEGFTAVNRTDALAYLLLDGVPVVAVPPGRERYVIGPQRGRYAAQWRRFLGERVDPVSLVEMPARIEFAPQPAKDAPPRAAAPPVDAGAPHRKP